jgi:low affinity Fe/Cu permease
MKYIYRQTERFFEKLTSVAITILGNSITFIIALITVIFWLSNKLFYSQDLNDRIGDIIQGITFLSLFIIQKSFKRFAASLHLKVNELVKTHEPASNEVINTAGKTDREIIELLNEYGELTAEVKDVG